MSDKFDLLDLDTFYDKTDENGIDILLPPSPFNNRFKYKATPFNEKLIEIQQHLSQSYSKMESDIVRVLGLYSWLHNSLIRTDYMKVCLSLFLKEPNDGSTMNFPKCYLMLQQSELYRSLLFGDIVD